MTFAVISLAITFTDRMILSGAFALPCAIAGLGWWKMNRESNGGSKGE